MECFDTVWNFVHSHLALSNWYNLFWVPKNTHIVSIVAKNCWLRWYQTHNRHSNTCSDVYMNGTTVRNIGAKHRWRAKKHILTLWEISERIVVILQYSCANFLVRLIYWYDTSNSNRKQQFSCSGVMILSLNKCKFHNFLITITTNPLNTHRNGHTTTKCISTHRYAMSTKRAVGFNV